MFLQEATSPALPSAGLEGPRLRSAGRRQQHMKPGRPQPQTRQPDSHFLTLTKQKGDLRKTEHGTDMKHQEGRLGGPSWGDPAGGGRQALGALGTVEKGPGSVSL